MRLSLLALLIVAGCGSTPPASEPDLAAPAQTWSNFAGAFFQSYCVSCHTPGGAAAQQDFNQYAVAKANASIIRCGVAPAGMLPSGCSGNPPAGQFPIGNGPRPSDQERLAIIAWIDNGAPL